MAGPDLVSIAAVVRPVEEGTIPRRHGYTAYGLALRLLRGVAPELADRLRRGQGKRPLATALLGVPAVPPGVDPVLSPASPVILRMSASDAATSAGLQTLEAAAPGEARLGSLTVTLEWRSAEAGAGGWRRQQNLADLAAEAAASRADQVTMRFVSPTVFRRERPATDLPFPLPELVYGSVANAWIRAGHERPILPDFGRVGVVAYRAESARYEVSWAEHVGFVGEVAYSLRRLAARERRTALLLAMFAFYSGVGDRTTQGMGVVRVEAGAPVLTAAAAEGP